MTQYDNLTNESTKGRVAHAQVRHPGGAHPGHHETAAEVLLADGLHQRAARLSASMSPQAAAVIPLMLALARLQARRAAEHKA